MTRPRFHQPTVSGALVEIADAGHALVVAPHFGGRIVSFRRDGRDILRPTPERDIAEPRVYGFAGFPLMPYSGPLFGPGFSFSGTDHELRRNVREEPTATHGEAWIASFTIQHRSARSLRLVHDHSPEDGVFPFAWRGVLDYALTGEGLEIDLRVTSRDHRPMPAGIGFHPYFPKPPGTRLRFDAVALWPPDAPEAVRLGCGPIVEGLDFTQGLDVSAIVLDRLYEGWSGVAELTAPDGSRTIIAADGALDKLQLYSAWDYPYVCVEPVSNANDGFNRAGGGCRLPRRPGPRAGPLP